MKVELSKSSGLELREGINAFAVFVEGNLPTELEKYTKGIKKERFDGKLGQSIYLESTDNKKVLLLGLGKKSEFKTEYIRRAAGTATRYAASTKEKGFSFNLNNFDQGSSSEFASAIAEGAILASYKSTEFKSKKEEIFVVEKVIIICGYDVKNAIEKAIIYAEAQNYARWLDEKPANIATPVTIANEAKKIAKELGFDCTVLEKRKSRK